MLAKLIAKYRSTTDLNRFLVKIGILFIPWRVFQKWMILEGQYTDFTKIWATLYLRIARFFLTIFGIETQINIAERKLWLNGADDAIFVAYDCLGVNVFIVFIVFVIAYFRKSLIKLWFIPMGMSIIFLLNALRMAGLTVIVAHYPQQMDLFHHFIFQGIIYLAVLAMWWIYYRMYTYKH